MGSRLVCFFLGGREFAAPIEQVRETVALRPITPLFGTPECVLGIINLRGNVVAVLDPAVMLGLPRANTAPSQRIVIIDADGKQAGLRVEALGAIRDAPEQGLKPVPPTMPARSANLMQGVVSLESHPLGGTRRAPHPVHPGTHAVFTDAPTEKLHKDTEAHP